MYLLGEQMTNSGSDFDAAKAISDILKDMEKERQQRVLRWVAESLDIALHVKTGVLHETITGTAGSAVGATALPTYAPDGRPTDVKSFVESKNPKNDIQFATVIAYYYRFEAPADDRLNTISADVLQNATRLAGRTRFANPLNTLNNAKKQGYLDASDRGAYGINSVGENLVAMTLPGSTNSAKPKPRPKQRPKATKAVSKSRRLKS
jgi:hypothetical protein